MAAKPAPQPRDLLDQSVSVLLAASAVAIAVTVVHREFSASGPEPDSPANVEDFVDFWEEVLPQGLLLGGDDQAPVTILVLVDLECPACRGFHRILAEMLERRPEEVRVVYVSHPLAYHPQSLPAARAAECAAKLGAFRAWVDVALEKQDSLGSTTWMSLAQEAGIEDPSYIQECAERPGTTPRIEAGLAFGSKIRMSGTPTVLVNGWRYRTLPTAVELDQGVTAVLRLAATVGGGSEE